MGTILKIGCTCSRGEGFGEWCKEGLKMERGIISNPRRQNGCFCQAGWMVKNV
jgi:hypothetical protein